MAPPKKPMAQSTLAGFFTKLPPSGAAKVGPLTSSSLPATPGSSAAAPRLRAVGGLSIDSSDLSEADSDIASSKLTFKPKAKGNRKAGSPHTVRDEVEIAIDLDLGPGGGDIVEEDEPISSRGRKLKKRKLVVDESSGSEADHPLNTLSSAAKSRASVASTSSGASSGKIRGGRFMKKPRYAGDSDDEFSLPDESGKGSEAAEDSDDYFGDGDDMDWEALDSIEASLLSPTSKKPSKTGKPKPSASKSKAPLRRPSLAKEKKMEKEEAESRVVPWEFLKNVRDADGNPKGSPNYDPRTLFIGKKDWATMTPFETQFWEIKQHHFDTVLFFQKGKFLELYEDDAWIGHQEFDLKITQRVKMSMVGVPEASTDYWIAKFLAKGHKVGRVDQVETALGAEMRHKGTLTSSKAGGKSTTSGAKAKGGREIVRRELKNVLTSGTITDGSMLTDDGAQTLLAIKETIDPTSNLPTIGLVTLDASTAEFNLAHFADDACRTHLETLIRRTKPKELVHERGGLSALTLRLLKNAVEGGCVWTALKAKVEFLEPLECQKELINTFGEEDAIPETVRGFWDREEAMGALGGLVWYLKQLNLDKDLFTAKNFNVYDPIRKGQTLQLDGQTLAHIEVLTNSQGTEEGTLLQLLARTITPFGKRLFRQWLCSPLQSVSAINDRLDAVDDMMANPQFEKHFDALARGIPDLERLISRIHAGSCTVKNFRLVLRSFAKISQVLKALTEVSEDFSSKGVRNLLRSAPELDVMLEHVENMFTGDDKELIPHEGKNTAYDAACAEEVKADEDLDRELEAAKKLLKCDKLVFKNIGIKDLRQIEVPIKIKVPSNWTKISGTKDVARYYTTKSEKLVKALKEARERKNAATNDFHLVVFEQFDRDYPSWLQAVKLVAELDCLLSLAKSSVALGDHACRPELVEAPTASLEFEELTHPCIIPGAGDGDFIPNDLKLGGEEAGMVLLTGPNMAGKSTLLRMTCTAVICAQLGCYVAAIKARISPVDRICTRMGASDAIFNASSTFKVEMDDARKILVESTPRSLVILDELGRGTSTYDGHAIAFAVLHRLATHVQCLGFFATHYSTLGDDFQKHPNIAHKFMLTSVDEETREVVFLYKLAQGSSPRSYGPHVAKLAGVPSVVVDRAIGVSADFEEQSHARQSQSRVTENLPLGLQADTMWLLNQTLGGGAFRGLPPKEALAVLNVIRRAAISLSA